MELRDLKYFEQVARLGHFGRAAEAVHRTQPAVSKSVQRLEAEFGTALFAREDGRLALTAAGQALMRHAQDILKSLDATRRDVTAVASGVAGHVRLGVSATAAEFLLPVLTERLLPAYPDITIEIELGMNDYLAGALTRRELDLVLAPYTQTAEACDFAQIAIDHVVVVASREHPLFRQPAIAMQDLQAYRWVLPSKSGATRKWLEQAFERRGLKRPVAQIESNAISLIPRLISSTTLLSFITRRNLHMEQLAKSVREIEMPETTMTREFGVLYRSERYIAPAVSSVLHIMLGK
ncbi:LysR family transcriptional regulator [Verticiella sediminum]|uniref:LysR family transcriptional regulator n=1 Tax=Verticiella sediminum TaxID=1247510 RepID=A0A556AUJ6_9BURK|nr:LysR family transcriptional regulator [Verticiella sediminum]TSH96614.1 LysR family transcriptional regulator [Verticiella sediminum]